MQDTQSSISVWGYKNSIEIVMGISWLSVVSYNIPLHELASNDTSMNLYEYCIPARWKVLDLVYSRRESRDKRPLSRDPDRTWCHRHTSVKRFWSQSNEALIATKKALY